MFIKELRYFRDTIYSRYIYQAPFPARPHGSAATETEFDETPNYRFARFIEKRRYCDGDICVAVESRVESMFGRLTLYIITFFLLSFLR